jgi:hypothetical protein
MTPSFATTSKGSFRTLRAAQRSDEKGMQDSGHFLFVIALSEEIFSTV